MGRQGQVVHPHLRMHLLMGRSGVCPRAQERRAGGQAGDGAQAQGGHQRAQNGPAQEAAGAVRAAAAAGARACPSCASARPRCPYSGIGPLTELFAAPGDEEYEPPPELPRPPSPRRFRNPELATQARVDYESKAEKCAPKPISAPARHVPGLPSALAV